jgi:hypothetical protein
MHILGVIKPVAFCIGIAFIAAATPIDINVSVKPAIKWTLSEAKDVRVWIKEPRDYKQTVLDDVTEEKLMEIEVNYTGSSFDYGLYKNHYTINFTNVSDKTIIFVGIEKTFDEPGGTLVTTKKRSPSDIRKVLGIDRLKPVKVLQMIRSGLLYQACQACFIFVKSIN